MKKIIACTLIVLTAAGSMAQEVISNLGVNPVLKERSAEALSSRELKSSQAVREELWLPFFDDFSSSEVYPSAERWVDNFAFINSTYPVFPPSRGVATLDAINEFGEIYAHATPGPQHFLADFLTSRAIRLDSVMDPEKRAITTRDSVYFSFYYQPQGYGNAPEVSDSLVLEFGSFTGDSVFSYIDSTEVLIDDTYFPGDSILLPCQLPEDSIWVSADPYLILHNNQMSLIPGDVIVMPCDSIFVAETQWDWIWSTTGQDLDTLFYDETYVPSYFKKVMIPITDSLRYYKPDFQFRFKNYASLANNTLPSWQSNMDHWHVDYVYLNTGRSIRDTTSKDLTFVYEPASMIKTYESMPYEQYVNDPIAAMKDSVDMVISNRDTLSHNSIYTFYLRSQNNQIIDSCERGVWDIPPVYTDGFLDYINFTRPPVCFGFFPVNFNEDSAIFTIEHALSSAPGSSENLGDTVTYTQKFYNYYAYDDGTPEAGYGLTPAGAQLACKFLLNKADTLRAIQMYFNETLNGANQQYFNLTVWNNNAGMPGSIVYSQAGERPVYTKELNKFHTYHLDSAIAVSGTFFVGWAQTTDDNLNVGFDRNNRSGNKIYYNVMGDWIQSIQQGSLMIRPVTGKPIRDVPEEPIPQKVTGIDIFPNPVKDADVTIELPPEINDPAMYEQINMKIFNIMGQVLYSGVYRRTFNTTGLNDGIYIITIRSNSANRYYTEKMVVTR